MLNAESGNDPVFDSAISIEHSALLLVCVDVAERIQNEGCQFAVVLANFEAVEPEFVALGVGEPTAGWLLVVGHYGAADFAGPGVIARRDLLCHPNPSAGHELAAERLLHGGEGKGGEHKGQRWVRATNRIHRRVAENAVKQCDLGD